MKYLIAVIFIGLFLTSCEKKTEVNNPSARDYYLFTNDSLISDKNGYPVGSYSSYFPYDSVVFERRFFLLNESDLKFGILKNLSSAPMEIKMFKKKGVKLRTVDTLAPEFYRNTHIRLDEGFLKLVGEKILWNSYLGHDIYRLTIIESNTPSKIISLEKINGKIIFKVMSIWAWKYKVKSYEFELDKIKDLEFLLDKYKFYQFKSDLPGQSEFDGAFYYFESHTARGYKLIAEENPEGTSVMFMIYVYFQSILKDL